MDLQDLVHLMNRAGFGLTLDDARRFEGKPMGQVVGLVLADSATVQPLDYLVDPRPKEGEVGSLRVAKELFKSKKDLQELNLAWIDQMGSSKAVLREKMTLFWHTHFATSTPLAFLMQQQNNMLRRHALGSFRDMLHAVSQDPAMILYLNNQQNKRKAPNENFAREVMELFTLGEGQGYTEADIKEAARAFTGWHLDKRGDFHVNPKAHDNGSKTVFGKTGDWNGNDVVDMLLEKPETAQRIVSKLYRFLVNETPNQKVIEELSTRFRSTDYDISDLLVNVFGSSWFYAVENKGAVIKSPAHLLAQYKRTSAFTVEKKKALLKAQQAMGQVLFFPPNVAGWKGGRAWIDATTLLARMRLPELLLGRTVPGAEPPMPGTRKELPIWGKVKVEADWSEMNRVFSKSKDPAGDLLQMMVSAPSNAVHKPSLNASGDSPAAIALHIMALPEYQLA